jgi:cytochrome c oxidase subunit 3
MSTIVDQNHDLPAAQSLGESPGLPLGVSWQKLMMWIFLVSDGLLFASLLVGYSFVRLASPAWPAAGEVFHLSLIGFMTFLLISSSATMGSAVAAASRGDLTAARRFIYFTMIGGAGFLGMQVYEWTTLIQEGARLHSNPWGVPLFSASFFLITGFHGTHVLSGLLILAIVALRLKSGKGTAEGVELAGLYWHFVDLVWVFIFTLFYLV